MPVQAADPLAVLLAQPSNNPTTTPATGPSASPTVSFDSLLLALQVASLPSESTLATLDESNVVSTIPPTDLPEVSPDLQTFATDDLAIRLAIANSTDAVNDGGTDVLSSLLSVSTPTLVSPVVAESLSSSLNTDTVTTPVDPTLTEDTRSRADQLQAVRVPASVTLLPTATTLTAGAVSELGNGPRGTDTGTLVAREDSTSGDSSLAVGIAVNSSSIPIVAAAVQASVPSAVTPGDLARAAARPANIPAQAPIVPDRSQVVPADAVPVPSQGIRPPAESISGIAETPAATPSDDRPLQFRDSTILARESQSIGLKSVTTNPEFAQNLRVAELVPSQTNAVATPSVLPPEATVTGTDPSRSIGSAPLSGELSLSNGVKPAFAPLAGDRVLVSQNRLSVPSPDGGETGIAEPIELAASTIPGAFRANPESTVANAVSSPAIARPAAAQLSESIVEHAALARRDGAVEFQIRLDPPELGPVKLKLVAHGDRMSAELVVANDAIRSLVESQLPELRARLEQSGVHLPDVDVNSESGHRQRADSGPDERQRPTSDPRPVPARLPRMTTARLGSGTVDITV